MFLVINKFRDSKGGTHAVVHQVETTQDVAKLVKRLGGPEFDPYDVHHQVKGTGRWDSENLEWTAIPALPDWATETD